MMTGREALLAAATILEEVPEDDPLAVWASSIAAYVKENLAPRHPSVLAPPQ